MTRLTNIDRAYAEVREQGMTCVRIRPKEEKGQIGTRTGITPEEVCSYIAEVMRDFQGEIIIHCWKQGASTDDQLKYIVVAGGPAQMNGMGAAAGLHPMILQLMQQNHATQLELLKTKLEHEYGDKETNHTKEAIGLFKEFLLRSRYPNGNVVDVPPARPEPARVGGGRDAEEEEGDVLDDFMEVEPEAEDLLERLIALKKRDPERYALAKSALKDM